MPEKMSQRVFIEAATAQVKEAKERILPLFMLELPERPWTSDGFSTLYNARTGLEAGARRAVELLYRYELPLLKKEEELVAHGLDLEADLTRFETALFAFERWFWDQQYQDYLQAPEASLLADHDLCSRHRLSKDVVRRVIRAQGLRDFAEVAPLVGADLNCGACRLGVTRLLIDEVRHAKEEAAVP